MENNLFRKTALETVSSPEKLNEYIQITNPGIWTILTALLVLVGATIFWGVNGNIPNTVSVKGIVFSSKGVVQVIPMLERNLTVKNMLVEKGDKVKKNQIIAILEVFNNKENKTNYIDLKAPVAGIILHTMIENQAVLVNEAVVSIINQDVGAHNEHVIAYIESSIAKRLEVGMNAHVTPFFTSREESGYMYAEIGKVGKYPESKDEIIRDLGLMEYATDIMPDGDFVRVDIELIEDENSEGGIKWSNPIGESLEISLGTEVDIDIVIKNYKPYELVFKGNGKSSMKNELHIRKN